MDAVGIQHIEYNIARCRVVLSVAALLVVYIDPETPLLARWIPFVSGSFMMDPRLWVVMLIHLVYSAVIFGASHVQGGLPARLVARTLWVDVLFGVVIASMTEGVTSPAYPFFAFTVVVSGLRGGLRAAMVVTTVNLALYLCLIVISTRGTADIYIMRPVYLAITGYLVGYLGQQRLELLEQMRQLEVAEQRHRIARDLHDGYAQALAGVTLRLEGARRLLGLNAVGEALGHLTDLQESVNREYTDLRRYARRLAGVEATAPAPTETGTPTLIRMRSEVAGTVDVVEHVLGILREGIHNIALHARARTATVEVRAEHAVVKISIDDDGIGFPRDVTPWSIASRVKEIGGQLEILADRRPGAHVLITLPTS